MARVVKDVRNLLLDGVESTEDVELNQLWDELRGVVEGGQNYGDDEAVRILQEQGYLAVWAPRFRL